MSTTTASGSGGTNNNVGRIMTGGTVNTPNFNGLSIKNAGREFKTTTPSRGFGTGTKNAVQGASVTASAVADDGTGYCDFTKTSHGLVVGDVIEVSGATADSLNTVHTVTGVPDANSIVTNVFYTASATAGVYKKQLGNFSKMTEGEYLGTYISPSTLAGLANTALAHNGGIENHNGINRSISGQRLDETSWNYLTHAVTKGANAGDSYNYTAAKGSGTVDEASLSVHVSPSSVTYFDGDAVPTTTEYPAYTG